MSWLREYKNVGIYLFRFLLFYLIAIKIYNYYLSYFSGKIDPLTRLTATQVKSVYTFLNIPSEVIPTQNQGIKLLVYQQYVARIVEGCNAVSIVILFTVFILSFWKFTSKIWIFIGVSIFSIFILNVLRIALLGYILYAFPGYQDFWHRVIFPGIIYSWIVFLWILFINKILFKNE